MHWIKVVHDKKKWLTVVKTEINLRFRQSIKNLTSWKLSASQEDSSVARS